MRKILFLSSFFIGFLIIFSGSSNAYNAPDFHNSSITATMSNSDRVPADGKTDAVLTVTVKDAYGTALAGEIVSLVVTNDTAAIVAPTSTYLDSSGKAIFYVRSTKEGVDSLDIVDKTQNVTLPGIGHVTFYSTTCTDSAPGGAPKLLSATPLSNTQIKLTWTKAADPVSFYTVNYGTQKGLYTYGNPNVGGANTTSYTVGSLSPSVTYYFSVIPGNGCTLGPGSNELAAKASLPKDTLTPTPTPTLPLKTPTATPRVTDVITDTPTEITVPSYAPAIIIPVGILLLLTGYFLYSRR